MHKTGINKKFLIFITCHRRERTQSNGIQWWLRRQLFSSRTLPAWSIFSISSAVLLCKCVLLRTPINEPVIDRRLLTEPRPGDSKTDVPAVCPKFSTSTWGWNGQRCGEDGGLQLRLPSSMLLSSVGVWWFVVVWSVESPGPGPE